jgi:tetratricopeptide (TPR) repeat protein
MAAEYDVFLSHAWADGDRPAKLKVALEQAGLRVWFDAAEISDFTSITRAVTEGLAHSKALVSWYSKTYPLRRACQWELTAAFLAAQREGDPRRRVLVVNPEPSADHIHPIELRDAKFRSAPKDGGNQRNLAQAIARHVTRLRGPLTNIYPLTAPNWYGTTPVGSTRFVGRLAEMWQIHTLLHAGDVTQITGAVVATGGVGQISGLGGVGKSLLAEEYALHFGAAYPGGVFWLRAYGNDDAKLTLSREGREAERTAQVQTIAERMGIATYGLSLAQIEGELSREIESVGKPCLWIVDDVPNGLNGEALRRWFAPHSLAKTLLTSRSREYGSLAKSFDLSVLAPEEAYQLVTSRRTPANVDEAEQARFLAADLGYHALALDVTASALQHSVVVLSFADFRSKLRRPGKDAMALAGTLAEALPNGHEKSIAHTMLQSIRNLGEEGQDFLRFASVLAVAPIPASLVVAVFEQVDELNREDAEERATLSFHLVAAASLAEYSSDNPATCAVHTLVSRTMRFWDRGSPERIGALRQAAVMVLTSAITDAARDSRTSTEIELLVMHARHIVENTASVEEADLMRWVGRYERVRGAFDSARTIQEQELEFRRRTQGPEHKETLTSINNLAVTVHHQGDLVKARDLLQVSLEARLRLYGPEHPDTLFSMANLAEVLSSLGDQAGARRLQEDVLRIRLELLGPDDLTTLISMSNLGCTLFDQGDLAGARRLLERSLQARRRLLSPQHPETLHSMVNLASVMSAQGELSGASELQKETLAIQRRILGPDHPDTLGTMNNLARSLWSLGDLAGARELYAETLEIKRHVLGVEHPDTAGTACGLYEVLKQMGEHKTSRKVLKSNLRWLVDRNPETLPAFLRNARIWVAREIAKRD